MRKNKRFRQTLWVYVDRFDRHDDPPETSGVPIINFSIEIFSVRLPRSSWEQDVPLQLHKDGT